MTTTSPKKKSRKPLIAVRISTETLERLNKRVANGKKRGTPTTLGAVARALLEEHA